MSLFSRNFFPVIHVLGYVVMMFAVTLLIPLGFALVSSDHSLEAYDSAFIVTLLAGAAMAAATHRYQRELKARDGFMLVTLVWTVLPAFATLPLLNQIDGLSFSHAYFEAMSGLTTTGASVLSTVENLPLSINVWRHLLVWLGGMGILVLAVAVLPLLGVGGAQAFKVESSAPFKENKLSPRIADTAKALYAIYFGISIVCFFAYALAGMGWADAFMIMCSTMGLGGFTPHDTSFAYWNNPLIDYVAMLFMSIAGLNFTLHFVALKRRSARVYWRDAEARAYIVAVLAACAIVTAFLMWRNVYDDFPSAFRYGVFNTISVLTTAGFANADFNQWPIFAPILMLIFSGFASNSRSTGGGIKTIRALILLKQAKREFTRVLHSRAISPVTINGQVVENKVIFAVLAFMLIYGAAIICLTMLLLLSGLDLVTAFTAVVACINNVGPGLNQVGPAGNYGALNDFQIWVCAFAMLIGRLELISVLVLFTPAYWRK